MRALHPLLALLTLPSGSHAWGSLGHTTVAYIASNLISPPTTILFQNILHNTTEHFLASVATWADSYRYTAAGRFSGPLHFIDAADSPPQYCGVDFERDCGGEGKGPNGGKGVCIVGAVKNYTNQILDRELIAWRRTVAAKFVVHFLGDIHQPLHTEGLLRGGNSIPVNFTNKVVNLHHVWDTSIPEHLIGSYSLPRAQAWAHNLTLSITSGDFSALAPSWLEGIDLEDPIATSMRWANEANAWVCSTVLPEGVEGVKGKELSGLYYEEGIKVVEIQIARAGVRLARWLDLIAEAISKQEEKGEL